MKGKLTVRAIVFGVMSFLTLNLYGQDILLDDFFIIDQLDELNEDTEITINPFDLVVNTTGFLDYSISGVVSVEHGIFAINPDDPPTITYTPDLNFNGTEIFTVTGCVNSGAICDDAEIILTIVPVPDNPIAHTDSANTFHTTPVTVNVVSNDEDIDGNGLDLSISVDGANGTSVVVGTSSIQYTPGFGFLGFDIVTYRICDAGSDVYCDEGTLKITVNSDNFNKPIANPDEVTVYANDTISIDVVANDYDGDGDQMTITDLIPGDVVGEIAITDTNTVAYTSAVTGIDSFYYVICDVNAPPKCDTTIVRVTVNEAPVVYPEIHVPNSFSPNNDGINDNLEIVGLETYASFHLRIYNRWNDIVYETDDISKMWNGRANSGFLSDNTNVPEGTYFYILDLQGKADPLRGFIVLKR